MVGASYEKQSPSAELDKLIYTILPLISNFIDEGHNTTSESDERLNSQPPEAFARSLHISLPKEPLGTNGLINAIEILLGRSTNAWNPKYMSKLSSATNPVGVISELILGVLNANVLVFETSPALSSIEKLVSRELAALYGFNGPHAGGICQPGGSTANLTAVVVARNTFVPQCKQRGLGSERLVMFTSEASHFSFTRAAMITGLGSSQVCRVPVDQNGCMQVENLCELIKKKREEGYMPFFVNATAGTTVEGAFDPLEEIGEVCKREGLWLHIDGSWGSSIIFSEKQNWRLRGSHLANSLTINPHKMLGVPLTCSFLLTNDLRLFHRANSIEAPYLFHSELGSAIGGTSTTCGMADSLGGSDEEVWDIADLTLQCSRRGDALKMALGWIYYGSKGYGERVDSGYELVTWFSSLVHEQPDLTLVSQNPPPCLQVCFYFAPDKILGAAADNSQRTISIQKALRSKGFQIDYALGKNGYFFRAVTHPYVPKDIFVGLLKAIVVCDHEFEQGDVGLPIPPSETVINNHLRRGVDLEHRSTL